MWLRRIALCGLLAGGGWAAGCAPSQESNAKVRYQLGRVQDGAQLFYYLDTRRRREDAGRRAPAARSVFASTAGYRPAAGPSAQSVPLC